jgi:ferrous-iron efflux pump FieF
MAEQDFPTEARKREMFLLRFATYASICVAVTLIVAKLAAWFATGSVSMLSSLVDSILDAAASAVNLLAVRHALQPADREHRFGHGKAEALAGLGQAAFIAGSGLFVLMEGIGRLYSPQPVEHGIWGIAVMVLSIVLTAGLVAVQRYVIRHTSSLAINADSFHYQIDLITNASIIASLALSVWFGLHFVDPLVALGIVVYMAYGSLGIAREAVNQLMDHELPDDDRNRIRQIALAEPAVKSVHDLRTRAAGANRFIQIHLEMDRSLTLIDAHEISDRVMYNIEAAFPHSEVLVHQDPEGVEERRDAPGSAGSNP